MREVLIEVQERRKDRSLVGSKALDVEIQLLERKKSFSLVEEMIKVDTVQEGESRKIQRLVLKGFKLFL